MIGLLLAAAAAAPAAAPAPDYVMIRREVVVDRPAAEIWAKVGGWCTIAHWLDVKCETVAGSGDVGSVRRLNGTTLEAMVGRTPLSYTYWQLAGAMAATGYHGTLAAEPIDAGHTRLTYTLFYDQAALPSDAVRASEHARLDQRFVAPLERMKQMAEAQ